MNPAPAIPANLINPSFEALEERTNTLQVNFADDTNFMFKHWQTFHLQSNFASDISLPRTRNLFWRIWSNPNQRVSNAAFSALWQQCRGPQDLTPYRPDPRHWIWRQPPNPEPPMVPKQQPTCEGPSDIEPLPTPESPVSERVKWAEGGLAESGRTRRERTSSGAGGTTSSRPAMRRSASGRTVGATGTRGGRARPGLMRSRSSQNRQPGSRTSDNNVPTTTTSVERPNLPRRQSVNFEVPDDDGEWEDGEDDSNDQTGNVEVRAPGSDGSSDANTLVESDFRSQFELARQMSSGTSFTPSTFLPRIRSSVRFSDDTKDAADSPRRKQRLSFRERSHSQVLADSDDSDETVLANMPRNASNLSQLIKDKRQQSGTLDLGPAPPDNVELLEAKKKEEELLRKGREAAKPNIPRSRHPSKERPSGEYIGPDDMSTF